MTNKIEEIGKLFQERRKELGLTQEKLGEKVGVTKSEISKIEKGRGITFATINKISDALQVSPEITLKSKVPITRDMIHYVVMTMGMFARQKNLSRKEACNYLARFKGLDFSVKNYETEHQLSLQECVDDMTAICNKNGGIL